MYLGRFGPLIAAGILGNMEGKLGHPAWRWLFYIEGALTMFFAVVAVFILPDFPRTYLVSSRLMYTS